MTLSRTLIDLLKKEGIGFEVVPHTVTYTSQETAASIHTTGREVAKPVILTDGDEFAMVVLDAPHRVDLEKFSVASGIGSPHLASESEIKRLFPDCEVGAMPPFGNLYGMPTYVDRRLEADDDISFDAGSHYEAIKMKYVDFKRLATPAVGDFAMG
jgi:Ala-tRNA(Pro) deacylase